MGLDTTHDAWHGAYSAFNRFRAAVCKAAGGAWPPHEPGTRVDGEPCLDNRMWYVPESVTRDKNPGLYEFLCHEDCEGSIAPDMCAKVADDLEALLPTLDEMGLDWGHLERCGGPGGAARKFIAGCRAAHVAGEPLEFH